MIDYSVIVPVYNGEKTVRKLIDMLKSFFQQQQGEFQIVIVYDCGKDNSWQVLKELKQENPKLIKLLRLTRNFGQHNALIAGIKHAEGRFFITMDDDLQHQPADIEKLIKAQEAGDFDLVYGKYKKLKHSFARNMASRMVKKFLQWSVPDLHGDYTSFRIIKADIARQTLEMNNSYTFLDGYLAWVTTNVSSTEVEHSKRAAGKSNYSLAKLLSHSINIFVTFSNLPIRFVTISSLLIMVVSLLYSIYLIARKLILDDFVPGYASVMVIAGFGIGIILFSIGVVGEYIYRINQKTTRRPNFIEKEVL